ncbi:MAG: hydroxyacylglutathione hydrolase [Usitatibacter sp.]
MQIHAVSAFKDNYIWVLENGREAVAVDPGDARPVQRFLEEHSLRLAAVIGTHHHADHVGGLEELVQNWKCPTFGPKSEVSQHLDTRLAEGDRISLPGLGISMQALDIPGHTAGHIALAGGGMLFCGDTLFACGCGRLFEGTPAQMMGSLGKLAALAPQTRVYCGHEYTLANIAFAEAVEPGNRQLAQRKARESAKRARGEPTLPSTIGEELATNPFLRCNEPEVVASAERHSGGRLAGPLEVFAEIRNWKNNF